GYDWDLNERGPAEKAITGRLTLLPGHYLVEIYVNGELLTSGSFTIADEKVLPVPPVSALTPGLRNGVGDLKFGDDFADNTHGWWTGTTERSRDGHVDGGEYVLRLTTVDDYWRVSCMDCGPYNDFYYEATARYVDGPTEWGFGLVARADVAMNNLYYFII